MLRILVRAPVKPTEDPAKVRRAIESLFPGSTITETSWGLVGEAPDLKRLAQLIRSDRIPDTARGVMAGGLSMDGMSARFALGKQAAAAGRAHFGAQRSPLGDLEVVISGTEEFEVERLFYETAPDTTCAPEWAEIPPGLRPAPT